MCSSLSFSIKVKMLLSAFMIEKYNWLLVYNRSLIGVKGQSSGSWLWPRSAMLWLFRVFLRDLYYCLS